MALFCAGRPHKCVLACLAALVNLTFLFAFYVALENGEGVKAIVKDIAGNNAKASGGKSRRTSCHCVLCGDDGDGDGDGEHAAKSANTTHERRHRQQRQQRRQQQQYEHTFSVKIRGDGHGAAALHLVS